MIPKIDAEEIPLDQNRLNEIIKYDAKKAALLFGLTLSCVFVIILLAWTFLTFGSFPGHRGLNFWLLERLVRTNPLSVDYKNSHTHAKSIIYVLGGSQQSLRYRYKTAIGLYRKGEAQKILILSRPGITEYDPLLERNLTNDEWSIKRLEEWGVRKDNIEPLSFKYGFFGTLTEARGASQEVINKGYDVLILVTSSYHTARVSESFSKYLKDKRISMFVYGSDDYPPLWGLLLEYFKLLLYKYILL